MPPAAPHVGTGPLGQRVSALRAKRQTGILNDPQVDPASYLRSSPIEYAAGLADPLLIAHGVIDDNVLFEDSMRLYQRLIELHKDNFTLAPYPLDRHGFTNADSWLDEYKRIDQLFERSVRR